MKPSKLGFFFYQRDHQNYPCHCSTNLKDLGICPVIQEKLAALGLSKEVGK